MQNSTQLIYASGSHPFFWMYPTAQSDEHKYPFTDTIYFRHYPLILATFY